MDLWKALRRLAMAGGAVIALLAACASPPIARQGDLVRLTSAERDRVQGSLIASGPDSIAISTAGGGVSLARDSIESLELDQRVRRRWVRPLECVIAPLMGVAGVSQFRDDEGLRAVISLTLAGAHAGACLRSHVWVSAELPEPTRDSSYSPDSISSSR